MKILKLAIIITFIFLGNNYAFSQSKTTKKADAAFNTGEYFKAAEMYEKIFEKASEKEDKAYIAFQLGECYRIMLNTKDARKWYSRAVRYKYKNPLATLYNADALKAQQKYDEAKIEYQDYLKLVPDDFRGKNGVISCENALKWINNPAPYIVEEASDINSNADDFCPSYGQSRSEVYFSSNREGANGKNTSEITGRNFSDIFIAKKDRKEKWSLPVPVTGGVNTPGSEGAAVITDNGAHMYYSSCRQVEGANYGCKIYKSRKNAEGWSEGEIVEIIGDSSVSVAHPAITDDGLTLYFVSDSLPGQKSIGGKDIWYVQRPNATAKWSKPINAGDKINTPGDEKFPYVNYKGELFFSSDGHPGIGGLDIFKAVKENNKWTVENMKPPINSSENDFGITFYQDSQTGYFSSSRNKSIDLFSFRKPPIIFVVKGIVVNSSTDQALPEAKVTLSQQNGKQNDVLSASDGSFIFNIDADVDFYVLAEKEGFLRSRINESTKGYTVSKTFEIKLDLGPVKDVFELPNIEYDVADTTLRPESMVSLDKLVEILEVNPHITIELSSNTDFRGGDDYNQKLSLGRANSVVKYLVSKGIKQDRFTAVGKGEKNPRKMDYKTIKSYDFLKPGDVLTEEFIINLSSDEQKEICHQLNRRTEFRVLRDDYGLKTVKFGSE